MRKKNPQENRTEPETYTERYFPRKTSIYTIIHRHTLPSNSTLLLVQMKVQTTTGQKDTLECIVGA